MGPIIIVEHFRPKHKAFHSWTEILVLETMEGWNFESTTLISGLYEHIGRLQLGVYTMVLSIIRLIRYVTEY